ncbi:MAG: hypothetical protein ACIAS6_01000 [Phycisphaerales bacterium JB060]
MHGTDSDRGEIRLALDSLPEATPGYYRIMDWLVEQMDDLEDAMGRMDDDPEGLYDVAELLVELEAKIAKYDNGVADREPLPEGAMEADPRTQDPEMQYRVMMRGMRELGSQLEELLGTSLCEWERPEPVVEDDGEPVPTPRRFGVQMWQNNQLQVGFVCFPERDEHDQEAAKRSGKLPIHYVVHRRIGEGRWELLCDMGMPFIRDASLPPNTKRVLYRVTAHRFGRFGLPGYVAVGFSEDGTTTVCEENPTLVA